MARGRMYGSSTVTTFQLYDIADELIDEGHDEELVTDILYDIDSYVDCVNDTYEEAKAKMRDAVKAKEKEKGECSSAASLGVAPNGVAKKGTRDEGMEFPEFLKAFTAEVKRLSPAVYRKARGDLEKSAKDYFNSPDAFDGPIDSAANYVENAEDLGFEAKKHESAEDDFFYNALDEATLCDGQVLVKFCADAGEFELIALYKGRKIPLKSGSLFSVVDFYKEFLDWSSDDVIAYCEEA